MSETKQIENRKRIAELAEELCEKLKGLGMPSVAVIGATETGNYLCQKGMNSILFSGLVEQAKFQMFLLEAYENHGD